MDKRSSIKIGLDSPIVIINFLIISAILGSFSFLSFYFLKDHGPWVRWIGVAFNGIGSLYCLTYGLLMLRNTSPKIAYIRKIAGEIEVTGRERILDMGCGSGLFLIEMAKKVPYGECVGVDLWRKQDESGNTEARTRANLDQENLNNRVELVTADICFLPYSENSFDIVVSSLAFHTLESKEARQKAVFEMLRVLKPNGKFYLIDNAFTKEYASVLKTLGAKEVQLFPQYKKTIPSLQLVSGVK